VRLSYGRKNKLAFSVYILVMIRRLQWFVCCPGVISVAYILAFVATKAGIWGFHMNFASADPEFGVPGILPVICDLSLA